jgi:hypothetical protein
MAMGGIYSRRHKPYRVRRPNDAAPVSCHLPQRTRRRFRPDGSHPLHRYCWLHRGEGSLTVGARDGIEEPLMFGHADADKPGLLVTFIAKAMERFRLRQHDVAGACAKGGRTTRQAQEGNGSASI